MRGSQFDANLYHQIGMRNTMQIKEDATMQIDSEQRLVGYAPSLPTYVSISYTAPWATEKSSLYLLYLCEEEAAIYHCAALVLLSRYN